MWWVDCVYMLSASCDYVQQKIDDHSPGITAQKAYSKKWLGGGGGCAQKAPLFQAVFRIIDSKYLLLGLIYLMGVGLHNLCTENRNLVPTNWSIKKTSPPPNFSQIQTLQGVSRFFQFMLFFIVEMI